MASIIKLNVGGTIFQTTKSTLTKFDGFFRTMFETGVPVTKDESGGIFIDRDPKHFRLILNFMRDGHVDLQKFSEYLEEIQKEAEFYFLDGLVESCKKYQKPVESVGSEFLSNMRFIKSDEELFKLTYKPKKPVMVFFGPISGGSIFYPKELDLLKLHNKYASRLDIYIRLFEYSAGFQEWRYEGYTDGKMFAGPIKGNANTTYIQNLERAMQKMISS